ncbi:MAG: ATP F0F1 synthase subunit B [Pseudomonadota bacterium]
MRALALLTAGLAFAGPAYAADSKGGLFGWLMDPVTNTAFAATVVFLMIVWRFGGFRIITNALDTRAATIRSEIEEARRLRDEASKALADAERRQQEAEELAEATIAQAKQAADQMIKDAHAELEQRLARRQAQAEARIARAETDAARDVRRAAAEAAVRAAGSILAERSGDDQFDQAIAEIEKSLN